jgi:RNA polymerase sigma-70 factor, ECF subfamily
MTAVPLSLLPFGFGPTKGAPDSAPRPGHSDAWDAVPDQPQRRAAAGRIITAEAHVQDSYSERSDEALVSAYLSGERAAFHVLIGRYANELLHFLTRFLGSRQAAEDVFQETFLQIHLSADTFDTERRFKPWLFTIAANKARDYHRKHRKRAPLSLSASIGEEGEGQCYSDLLECDLPSPDEPVLDAERSRLIKGVIDTMPPHLREILLLSYFQRLSYNQIADSLEIPLGTVKSRLHAAVAHFAGAWKAARASERLRSPRSGDREGQSGTGRSGE